MVIRWIFLNGPLDGLNIEGDAEESADCPLDLAAYAYRESLHGFPGATFDAFLPLVFDPSESSETTLRLHSYRVASSQQYRVAVGPILISAFVEIRAIHVGVADRVLTINVDRKLGSDAVTIRRQCSSSVPSRFPRTLS